MVILSNDEVASHYTYSVLLPLYNKPPQNRANVKGN